MRREPGWLCCNIISIHRIRRDDGVVSRLVAYLETDVLQLVLVLLSHLSLRIQFRYVTLVLFCHSWGICPSLVVEQVQQFFILHIVKCLRAVVVILDCMTQQLDRNTSILLICSKILGGAIFHAVCNSADRRIVSLRLSTCWCS